MSAITKRRTKHGHLQAWFVRPDQRPMRPPLTPIGGDGRRREEPVRQRRQGWYKDRWGFRRFRRGGRFGIRLGRSYSDRAPSLREPSLCEHILIQSGSNFRLNEPCYAENDCVCLRTLPAFLDEYGSNEILFAAPSAAVEGKPHGAPPMTREV